MRPSAFGLLLSLLPATVLAQANPAVRSVHAWRVQHERAIVDEYVRLLAIPNVASDKPNIQRNAEMLLRMMQARGISAKFLTTENANPVVYGELATPGATRTVVFYAHYDGQPVNEKEWASSPFTPVLRDRAIQDGGKIVPLPVATFDPQSRLYARSAGDEKLPIMALLAALDALHAAAIHTRSTLRFVFEGEEEVASPNLDRILRENRAAVGGDIWLICDSPTHPSRRQQLVFGATGLLRFDVTVYGASVELHGGHYGNWAPNAAFMLSRLIASMRDEEGHVLIPHFYDDVTPLTETEKRALAQVPDVDAQLLREFGAGTRVGKPKTLAELITLPALNLKGLASARVGAEAAAIVPVSATASMSAGPMKGMDYRKTFEQIVEHVRLQGYFVATDKEPSREVRMAHEKVALVAMRGTGYNGTRTSMDLPIAQEVIRAAESAAGPVIKLPTMGGAVPLEMIEQATGAPTIIVPTANHDNNQHGFDENLRIQNLWDGIDLMAALLTM